MENKVQTLKLGECAEIFTGYAFKSKEYENMGSLKVVRGDNVSTGFLRWTDGKTRYWNNSTKGLEKYFLKENDILIGMDGSRIGLNKAVITKEHLPLILAQRVACIRAKENYDQDYLALNILSDRFYSYVESIKTGTSIPHISAKQIGDFEIVVPDNNIQKRIGEIYSNFNRKINLNINMNKTLEEMAQAIFKAWFVDFEPFKDGEFEESELGMIPKGWKVFEIGDICEVKGGKRLPKGCNLLDYETEYPYLRVTDVTNGYINIEQIKYIDYDTRSKISNYIIRYEDIYISIAGTIGVVGTIYKSLDGASLTENMARIIVNDSNIFRNYIRLYLQSKQGQNNIKSRMVGSTQPKLPLYGIRAIPIIIPPNKIINDFAKLVNPIIEKIESNLNEISYLKGIRDTLLPKLISGEISLGNYQ